MTIHQVSPLIQADILFAFYHSEMLTLRTGTKFDNGLMPKIGLELNQLGFQFRASHGSIQQNSYLTILNQEEKLIWKGVQTQFEGEWKTQLLNVNGLLHYSLEINDGFPQPGKFQAEENSSIHKLSLGLSLMDWKLNPMCCFPIVILGFGEKVLIKAFFMLG